MPVCPVAGEAAAFAQSPPPTSGAQLPPGRADRDDEPDAIVVTGALQRGGVKTVIPAELQVERMTVRALGASSLAEVASLFAPQAQSLRGAGDPILLLDGRRIADRSEIAELPPEAILRIEVYPEDVAMQFGYPPNRRVFNAILRPSYRAIILQANIDVPMGEARQFYRARASILRKTPDGRLHFNLDYQRRSAMADRNLGTGADERWRLPQADRLAINGTYLRRIGALDLTVHGEGGWQREYWRLGQTAAGPGLEASETQVRGKLGVTLGAASGGWLWSAAAGLGLQQDSAATRDTAGGLVSAPGYSLRAARRDVLLDMTASGPVAKFGAGQAMLTLGGGLAMRRARTTDRFASQNTGLVRQELGYFSTSVDLPLVAGDGAAAFAEGRLTAVRGMGVLGRYGFGLRAAPLAGLSLGASYSRERSAPDFAALADLQVMSPNVRIYDFAKGSAVYAARRSGGNPALQPPLTRTIALRAQYKLLAPRNLALSFDYTDIALRDGISGLLGPTPQVEAAFPQRLERDSTGTLTGFDQRPVNILREDRRQLRWGINWSSGAALTGPAAPNALPARGQMMLAFYHTWMLRDDMVLAAGTGQIDLLGGGAIANLGGAARHRLDVQLGFASRELGLRLSGNWSSPSEVNAEPGGHGLRFHRPVRLDMRLFLDLKSVRGDLGLPWLTGRLYLDFDNLLGSKTRIHDANGAKVDIYRGTQEETGRAIHLAFRKIIQ